MTSADCRPDGDRRPRVAMLSDEPDAERFEAAVETDHIRLMSTASYCKRHS